MTAAIANLALNVIMVALLVATIGYCWLLNRRIKILQDSKSELAHLLAHFDESTQRASESIIALQTASKKIGENIQARIDKANFLLDDLSFMIEKGNKLANQMEASLAVGRARSKVQAQRDSVQQDSWDPEDLLPESLKAAASTGPVSRTAAEPAKAKSSSSLGAVLERLGNRQAARPEAKHNTPVRAKLPDARHYEEEERPRSKVEQELLEILRAGVKG